MNRCIWYSVAIAFLLASCIEEVPQKETPLVVDPSLALDYNLIGSYSASFDCKIGKTDRFFTSGGFLYGNDPDFNDAKTAPGIVKDNNLSIIVTDLAPGRTYYVKAYVSDRFSEVLSDVVSFESVSFDISRNTYDVSYEGGYVQLDVFTADEFLIDLKEYDWLGLPPATKSTNSNYSTSVSVSPNSSMEPRSAEITISSKDGYFREKVRICQSGAPVIFESSVLESYLLEMYDTNRSGGIELDEIPSVTEIELVNRNVNSLAGIEHFYNLKRLVCCGSVLNEADLQFNTMLEEVDLSYNNLTSINIFFCDRLLRLNCGHNRLKALDLSSAEALESLDCSFNDLESLDLSYNYRISNVLCNGNRISEFKSSRSNALKSLNCSENAISKINLSNNKGLETLDCSDNDISELNLSSNSVLHNLYCSDNNLGGLDLRRNPQLEILNCSKNVISQIDLRQIQSIKFLDCSNNDISTLDLSLNRFLQYLDCSGNQIQSLDIIGFCPSLTRLYCNNSYMSVLFVEQNRWIEGVTVNRDIIHTNPDTVIRDHSGKASFEDSEFKAYLVKYFDGDGDGEISLDEADKIAAINVCADNIRTLKGIEYLHNLRYVKCEGSDDGLGNSRGLLTELDLSNNPFIEQLLCGRNRLTSLNVKNNKVLRTLWCFNNLILELNLSDNEALTDLNCEKNHIETLDVSKCPLLKSLDCSPMKDWNEVDCLEYILIRYNQQIDFINSADHPRIVSNIPSGTAIHYTF